MKRDTTMNKLLFITIALMYIFLVQPVIAIAETMITFNESPLNASAGEIYAIRISSSEMERNPSWMPENGEEPPLGVKQAVQNAKSYVQEKLSYFANSFPTDVALRCFYTVDGCKDKWYYAVRLNNFVSNDPQKPYLLVYTGKIESITILVMMDGSVPELRAEQGNQPVKYPSPPTRPILDKTKRLSGPMPTVK